jgi:hypothetical protein
MVEWIEEFLVKPTALYGLQTVLICAGLMGILCVVLLITRKWLLASLIAIIAISCLSSIPLYHDTVKRVRDADIDVIRLWNRSYPGTFGITEDKQPGLPNFQKATLARVIAFTPVGANQFKFADECLRLNTGRNGEVRSYSLYNINGSDTPAACRNPIEIRQRFHVDIRQILQDEYNFFRTYARQVLKADGTAQDQCPMFYSERGAHQKQYLDRHSGLMKPEHDLSGHNCACVSLYRHKGCQAVSDRDISEGYIAHLLKNDFYTPLTCDLSSLCVGFRKAGFNILLTDDGVVPTENVAKEQIAQITQKCISSGQFSDEKREELCSCTSRIIINHEANIMPMSPIGKSCLLKHGALDENLCVVGEVDWEVMRDTVLHCIRS